MQKGAKSNRSTLKTLNGPAKVKTKSEDEKATKERLLFMEIITMERHYTPLLFPCEIKPIDDMNSDFYKRMDKYFELKISKIELD